MYQILLVLYRHTDLSITRHQMNSPLQCPLSAIIEINVEMITHITFICVDMELIHLISNRCSLECHSIGSQCPCFICKYMRYLAQLFIQCSIAGHCPLVLLLTVHQFIKINEITLRQFDNLHTHDKRDRNDRTVVYEEHHKNFNKIFGWRTVCTPTEIGRITI